MKDAFGIEEAIRRWDRLAESFAAAYGEHGDKHREVFPNPTLLDLIGPVQNKRVLDAN